MFATAQKMKEKMLELTRLFCIVRNIFQRFVIVYRYIRLLNKDPLTREILDDKRILLNKIFSNMSLKDHQLSYEYTTAYQFLSEWIPKLNATSELLKNYEYYEKTGTFAPAHSALLPHWQAFMSLKWFNEVKYPEYLQNEVNYFINLPEMQELIAKRRI